MKNHILINDTGDMMYFLSLDPDGWLLHMLITLKPNNKNIHQNNPL